MFVECLVDKGDIHAPLYAKMTKEEEMEKYLDYGTGLSAVNRRKIYLRMLYGFLK